MAPLLPFIVTTNHCLNTLFTAEMKNARVQRWAIMLSEYGGDIQYETGKTQKADLLSRVKANLENDGVRFRCNPRNGRCF